MQPYIIANWKMNLSVSESVILAEKICGNSIIENKRLVLCPSFVSLLAVRDVLGGGHGVMLGAQDLFYEDNGPFTGEISAAMLIEAGCSLVIVGHSERRALGENSEVIRKKFTAALRANLLPVLCVGESMADKKSGTGPELIASQLRTVLRGTDSSAKFLVAYEPLWAIGTGEPAGVDEAQLMHEVIADTLHDLKLNPEIIYGGSVSADTVAGFINEAGYAGVLVGGKSLVADEFLSLIANC